MFSIWNFIFIAVRLASIILSILTFWFGLADNEHASLFIRVAALAVVVVLQGYMMQRFITFHLGRYRENAAAEAAAQAEAKKAKLDKKAKKASKRDELVKKNSEEEISELLEVDQNTKSLRQRSAVKAKWFRFAQHEK